MINILRKDAGMMYPSAGKKGFLFFLLGLFMLVMSINAAPANNQFSSAVTLVGSAVGPIIGTTMGANLETGEFNPSGTGGASVWYKWTAPEAGWVSVDTVAANSTYALDTLVVIGTGSTAAGMLVYGFNDESCRVTSDFPPSVYPDGVGPSRLYFQAVKNTTYMIAVHGYAGREGTFELHLVMQNPPVSVSRLVANPSSVDVTQTSRQAGFDLEVQSVVPLIVAGRQVVIEALEPFAGGGYTASTVLLDTDRTSGTNTAGAYRISSVFVPQFVAPGTWQTRVQIIDVDGTRTVCSPKGNDSKPEDLIVTTSNVFQVVNAGTIDTSAPQLLLLDGLPATYASASGLQSAYLFVEVSDFPAGFSSGMIELGSGDFGYFPIGEIYAGDYLYDGINGPVYFVEVSLNPSLPRGELYARITLQDALGRSRDFVSDPMLGGIVDWPAGSNGAVQVLSDIPDFVNWAGTNNLIGAEEGFLATPARDGIPNMIKYASNLDPNIQVKGVERYLAPGVGLSGLPYVATREFPEGKFLSIEYMRRRGVTDLQYSPQFSGNLLVSPQQWEEEGIEVSVDPLFNGDWERVIVRDSVPVGNSSRFGRVQIRIQSP